MNETISSVSLSHDALLWAFWAPIVVQESDVAPETDPPGRAPAQGCGPRTSSGMGQIGMESHHHYGFPAIKKGPCHDLPRINGKITRNTMKYWDNSWFVASDI